MRKNEPLDDLSASKLEAEGCVPVVACREERLYQLMMLRQAPDQGQMYALASNLLPFSSVPL